MDANAAISNNVILDIHNTGPFSLSHAIMFLHFGANLASAALSH